jgi:hypothetical protein
LERREAARRENRAAIVILFGITRRYVRVESRWLEGEPFMPEGYGMTRDWARCRVSGAR